MRQLLGAALLIGMVGCGAEPAATADLSPAPPPCATLPPVVDHFPLVFFDANTASLTERARQVLHEQVTGWARVGAVRFIEVVGYTDAQEARTARPSLSLERAQAARAYLATLGVPAERMVAVGRGASQPLVPGDGPEPQNRRVVPYPEFPYTEADRQAAMQRDECRFWVQDHCFTPSRLAHAGASACTAALKSAMR